MPDVVTRFAPSPTGYLHIGSARTALFNWLFAKRHGGKFLLRIEDTDQERSTQAATDAIFTGMDWLGLDYDGEAISQFARKDRHAEVAAEMLAAGRAYKCFATQDEIAAFREAAKADGRSTLYRSPWRDADASTHPSTSFVIRLKAPLDGKTTIDDAVQGEVSWKNETLDDLVLLRSDGSPTYMLAVVVDDHDMNVSHVIRGDDHLTNAARQTLIYQAMDWSLPVFAHIPLIHGPDGKKMSKRHGATGVDEYRDMGYPAEAMRNYLARLGWSHGDDEFFTTQQATNWFNLEAIGKAPARFDFKKLDNLSGQHFRAMNEADLIEGYLNFAASQHGDAQDIQNRALFEKALPFVQERAKTYHDITEMSYFATANRPLEFDEKAEKSVQSVSQGILTELTSRLQNVSWTHDDLDELLRTLADETGGKLGQIAQPVRAALTGRATSPGVFHVMETLGREETLARLNDATQRLSNVADT